MIHMFFSISGTPMAANLEDMLTLWSHWYAKALDVQQCFGTPNVLYIRHTHVYIYNMICI